MHDTCSGERRKTASPKGNDHLGTGTPGRHPHAGSSSIRWRRAHRHRQERILLSKVGQERGQRMGEHSFLHRGGDYLRHASLLAKAHRGSRRFRKARLQPQERGQYQLHPHCNIRHPSGQPFRRRKTVHRELYAAFQRGGRKGTRQRAGVLPQLRRQLLRPLLV